MNNIIAMREVNLKNNGLLLFIATKADSSEWLGASTGFMNFTTELKNVFVEVCTEGNYKIMAKMSEDNWFEARLNWDEYHRAKAALGLEAVPHYLEDQVPESSFS